MPLPSNASDLPGFLGLTGYYRRFIRGFRDISACLHGVTSTNDREFVWDEEIQVKFEDLKEKLWSTPLLAYPYIDNPFILETDASSVTLGVVITH